MILQHHESEPYCHSEPALAVRNLLFGKRKALLRLHHGQPKPDSLRRNDRFLMARILHHKSGETDGFFPFWEVPPKTKQPRFSAGLL